MLFTWWDHASEYYVERLGKLTDYYFKRWDDIEEHLDYHVPNSNRELKIAMDTDSEGSTWVWDIDDGMEDVGSDNGYGVDSETLYYHDWPWFWDYLRSEIDDGIPILSGIDGHTMVGVAYNNSTYEYGNNDPNHGVVNWLNRSTLYCLHPVHPYDGWGGTIELTAPQGDQCWNSDCGSGEEYSNGDVCAVTWAGYLNEPGTHARISYSLEGGQPYSWQEIVSYTENDGSYDWVIPEGISSNNCRIKVMIYDQGSTLHCADGSWGNFKILPGAGLPELQDDLYKIAYTNPDFFKFHHDESSWCAVGIRSEILEGIWDIALYNDTTFVNLLTESTGFFDVNYVVLDGNQLAGIPHGIRVENGDGDTNAQVEYEGGTETLSPGVSETLTWPGGDVVEIWDVDLTPGDWIFDLDYLSGTADLDISLFYFPDPPYYGKRIDHFQNAFSTNYGTGVDETFSCIAYEAGTYGFCVQARDGGEAEFKISINPPGTWKGTVSSDWHDPDNWTGYVVPDADTDVVIPAGRPSDPTINGSSAWCRSLEIEYGATLYSWQDINANYGLTCAGTLVMMSEFSELDVSSGHVHWQSGAYFDAAASTMTRVGGNWTVDSGTDISPTLGTVIFDGYEAGSIKNHDISTSFYNLENSKNQSGALYFSTYCTEDFTIDGDLILHNDAMLEGDSPHRVTLKGGIYNLSGSYFHFSSGEFRFLYSDCNLDPNAGDYFNHLILNNSNVDMQADLTVQGDLTTEYTSTLDIWSFDMYLEGDWSNSAGSGVMPATSNGAVILNGEDDQTFYGDFDLPTLRLVKPGGHFHCPAGGQITCNSYDWQNGTLEVNGGTFNAEDIAMSYIQGNYILSSGFLTLHQDGSNWVDLAGNITISDGTMEIHGGYSIDSYWPYTQDASLTMSGGVLDIVDNGIFVYSTTHTFTDNITGGTIRTSGNFRGDRTDFNPGGGTIELYGSGDADLSHGIGSSFHDVTINKAGGARAASPLEETGKIAATRDKGEVALRYWHDGGSYSVSRTQAVTVNSTLDLDGELLVQAGTLETNGEIIDMDGDLDVYGGVEMTDFTGYLRTGGNIYWRETSTAVIDDGEIHCGNHWYFYNGCDVQLESNNTVYMEGGSHSYVLCYEPTGSFNRLIVDKSAGEARFHYSSSDTVRVTTLLEVKENNALSVGDCDLLVTGEVSLPASAIMTIGDAGSITVNDLEIDGTLAVDNGSALVHGDFILDVDGILNLSDGQVVCDRAYTGNFQSIAGALYMSDGLFEVSNDGLQFGADNGGIISGGTIRLGWGLRAIYADALQPTGGVVEFRGGGYPAIECNAGNYLHDLTVDKSSGAASLGATLTVEGDLHIAGRTTDLSGNDLIVEGNVTIENGAILDSDSRSISVGGDWINNRGDLGFTEETGTVTFTTYEPADLSGETFYDLNIDKPLYTGYFLTLLADQTVNVLHDLYVMDGTVLLTDNATLNVDNDLVIEWDAGLNAHDNYTGISISCGGNWINYNTGYDDYAGFKPGSSTVTFDGSGNQYLLASAAVEEFHNLVVHVTGYSFMPDSDLLVGGDCSITRGSWWRLVEGLHHTFEGDFFIDVDCDWEDDSAGITLGGTGDQSITLDGAYGFNGITVDKSAARAGDAIVPGSPGKESREESPVAGASRDGDVTQEPDGDRDACRSQTVTLQSDLYHGGAGGLTVETGELLLNGHALVYTGSADLLVQAGGRISGDPESSLLLGDGVVMRVYGVLEMLGSAGHEALVSHYFSGSYSLIISSGGTLSAEWTIFEYMGAGGISVTTSGLIDPFHTLHNCTFREGAPGAWLMRMDCDQDLTVQSAHFPENTWGGGYNMLKAFEPSPGNEINFANATGPFAGEDFDYDAYDAITWNSAIDIVVTGTEWLDPAPMVGDSARLYITMSNPEPVDSGPFEIGIYYDQPGEPDYGDTPDQIYQMYNLAGGAGTGFVIWITNEVAGDWTTWILANWDEEVIETDYGNNVGGPAPISWIGLDPPPVDDLTITYNAAVGSVVLTWTYPEWFSWFNIYRDTDPWFTPGPGNLIYQAPASNYAELVTAPMYFYKVTAVQEPAVMTPPAGVEPGIRILR